MGNLETTTWSAVINQPQAVTGGRVALILSTDTPGCLVGPQILLGTHRVLATKPRCGAVPGGLSANRKLTKKGEIEIVFERTQKLQASARRYQPESITRYCANSHKFGRRQSKQSSNLWLMKSGDVKGTIRSLIQCLTASNDVRRHRLISNSYILLVPCGCSALSFQCSVRKGDETPENDICRWESQNSGGTESALGKSES